MEDDLKKDGGWPQKKKEYNLNKPNQIEGNLKKMEDDLKK